MACGNCAINPLWSSLMRATDIGWILNRAEVLSLGFAADGFVSWFYIRIKRVARLSCG